MKIAQIFIDKINGLQDPDSAAQ